MDKRVIAGTVAGEVHALDSETGREEWGRHLGSPVSTTIGASDTDAYVGTMDRTLHRIDTSTGDVLAARKVHPNLKPSSVPVRAAGVILVLLTDGGADYRELVAVEPTLGRVRWQVDAPTTWSTTRVFVWGDVVVLGTAAGEVLAYCGDTGARAWTRTVKGVVRVVGGSGETLLVGTRTGELFALRAPQSCVAK